MYVLLWDHEFFYHINVNLLSIMYLKWEAAFMSFVFLAILSM